jgi:osmoprotectant transport system permease protein
MLFTDGLQRNFVTEVVVGILAILVLALLMDAVLVLLERLLTPWTRAVKASGPSVPVSAQYVADANVHAGAGP